MCSTSNVTPAAPATHTMCGPVAMERRREAERVDPTRTLSERDRSSSRSGPAEARPYCGRDLESVCLPRGPATPVSGDLSPMTDFSAAFLTDSRVACQRENVAYSDFAVYTHIRRCFQPS